MYDTQFKTQSTHFLSDHLPERVMDLLHRKLEDDMLANAKLLETASPINLLENYDTEPLHRPKELIINLKRINDIRRINKFFEAVNEQLPLGGYYLGCVEPSVMRYRRLEKKFIKPFNYLYIIMDYLIKRVWPKLPYFKRLYFLLTNGRNRVLSEMETYGRLVSCGFQLRGSMVDDNKLFFLVQKEKTPEFNMEASYGPLIRLRRIGKKGKSIRVYKFRTMYPYSEYIQDLVYEMYGLQEGGKLHSDPRVNRLGAFLRKYWLDELPMLFNLLRGDLKVFGVRPLSPHYLSLYPPEVQAFRKKFKPGLIPPFYVDLPKTLDEIVDSEVKYLKAYERSPLQTDVKYMFLAFRNIFLRGARSN